MISRLAWQKQAQNRSLGRTRGSLTSLDGCGTRVIPLDDSFGLTWDVSLRSAQALGLLSESVNSMGTNDTFSADCNKLGIPGNSSGQGNQLIIKVYIA